MSRIVLRHARRDDAEKLLAWRNDPETRAASRSTAPVVEEDHRGWLDHVLADPTRILLVAEADGGEAIGQARFDGDGVGFEISISLSPSARGKGLGAELIRAACDWLGAEEPDAPVCAWVRSDNPSSLAAFETAGFQSDDLASEDFVRLSRS